MHAIPSPKQVLREGDLISIDCGAVLDGWHGDAAITVGVGEVDPALLRMAAVAEDAMWAGIAAAARGAASGKGRLTDISHAVETAVRKARPVRHRRRVRRARHRHRDAPGPARAQPRPARQGPAAGARAWRWPSSR